MFYKHSTTNNNEMSVCVCTQVLCVSLFLPLQVQQTVANPQNSHV